MYTLKLALVHSELDNHENGCDPDSNKTRFFGYEGELHDKRDTVEAETLEGLLKEVGKLFNVDWKQGLLLDSCEELGRLDVQTYTKGTQAIKCSYKRYESDFKSGKINLYLNNISGTVTKTPEGLNLTAILESENNLK